MFSSMSDERRKSEVQTNDMTLFKKSCEHILAHAYSAIMFGALICTLLVKFYQAVRMEMTRDYYKWILSDIVILLSIEIILAVVCYKWRRRAVIRGANIFAAVICTWSVMNGGWIIRTGTQILPWVLRPLYRDPLNALRMVGFNLYQAPKASIMLLGPSAIALGFLFYVLAKPRIPSYNKQRFSLRVFTSVILIAGALMLKSSASRRDALDIRSIGLRYNSQVKAVISLFSSPHGNLEIPSRELLSFDDLDLPVIRQRPAMNVIMVILEGVQYNYTSLNPKYNNLTPFLARLAHEGVEFSNTRSTLTHTTKALFALLTGRFPSASQDLAETVPAEKPYMSLATILKRQAGYRTAFFQSAKGNFEARPGLVHNLGFDKILTRDDLDDPNNFVGYLACDEFVLLEPVMEWVKSDKKPFFLAYLCSVTHDHYEVPDWYGMPEREPVDRYRQTISYTDKFLATLDEEISQLGIAGDTILCVVSDHAEGFGEHGFSGHERIAFEEVLRIPFCIRSPFFIEPGTKIDKPVSSVDVTPTILGLLGFDSRAGSFDGINLLDNIPDDRKVYFGGWIPEGPAGYILADKKYVYDPANKTVLIYDLVQDPCETQVIQASPEELSDITNDVSQWRRNSTFKIYQQKTGRKILFDRWQAYWNNRVAEVKFEARKDNQQ